MQDQCDELIPELCQNFSFVESLELNLNNYALNFDNLPQAQHVKYVTNFSVKKNKFLFAPLVTMARNLHTLQIFFKEFTTELQDLSPLKSLKYIEISCMSDGPKHFTLNETHFQLKFWKPDQVDVTIKMPNFNLEMSNIFQKFCYRNLGVKRFEIQMKKLKFDAKGADHNLRNKYKDQIVFDDTEENEEPQHLRFPELQNFAVLPSSEHIEDQQSEGSNPDLTSYQLRKFIKNMSKKLRVYMEYKVVGEEDKRFVVKAQQFKFCI